MGTPGVGSDGFLLAPSSPEWPPTQRVSLTAFGVRAQPANRSFCAREVWPLGTGLTSRESIVATVTAEWGVSDNSRKARSNSGPGFRGSIFVRFVPFLVKSGSDQTAPMLFA
jgi:hypothetical protein